MRQHLLRWTLLVAMFVLIWQSRVMQAAPLYQMSTLDQSSEAYVGGVTVGIVRQQAQTFTAGRTGQLDRIELYVSGPTSTYQYPIQITAVDANGIPTGSALGSGSLDGNLLTGQHTWVSVAINPVVDVSEGVQYAIVVPAGSQAFFWYYSVGDTYPRGGVVPASPTPTADFTFRTYVLSSPATPTATALPGCVPSGNQPSKCTPTKTPKPTNTPKPTKVPGS
jgi:hypothetical protein